MKHLKLFEDFTYEDSGFGKKDFHLITVEGNQHYFFKLEFETTQRGFILTINKTSKFSTPAEETKEYGVISITELTTEGVDQAIIDRGEFEPNENPIEMGGAELDRYFMIYFSVVEDHLSKNPKIWKFYDEVQDKLENKEYFAELQDALRNWQEGIWNAQEIEVGRDIIITK